VFLKDEEDQSVFSVQYVKCMNERSDMKAYLHHEQSLEARKQSKINGGSGSGGGSDEAASAVLDYVCAYGHLPNESEEGEGDISTSISTIPTSSSSSSSSNKNSGLQSISSTLNSHKMLSSCSKKSPLCHVEEDYLDTEQFDRLKQAVLEHPRCQHI
jgi:hypothetical protein